METQEFYSNIMQLFQSHLEYRNIKANYKIQKLVLFATVISVIVAVMSLIVAIRQLKAAETQVKRFGTL